MWVETGLHLQKARSAEVGASTPVKAKAREEKHHPSQEDPLLDHQTPGVMIF